MKFKDNIWAADLAEMGSLFSKKKNVKYLLCVIDAFTSYLIILNAFIEIVNYSNCKLRVDQ